MSNQTQENTWQSRQIQKKCDNCVFFRRNGKSKIGQCGCQKSHCFDKMMFADDSCNLWQLKP